ncbi:MAG TPA: hypothetical protein VG013_27710 [Gemmataceae bacterium]|jgi:hypothetical protein|nr:hypothetical protein [Gemmataceae bacterium]
MRALLESPGDELELEVRRSCPEWRARAGQDEASPLIVPTKPDDLAPHYDLTISHPAVDQPSLAAFERWLAEAAARRGLSCAVLHDGVVHEAIRRLEEGRLSVYFHFDYFAMWHIPGDPYARLAHAVEDAGGRPVNRPARSRLFTDKSAAHAELLRYGLGVPETVLFRPWSADRPLTGAERRRLGLDEPGTRVYLKPANGFATRGVVRVEGTDPARLCAALTAARDYDRNDALLLQREVRCPALMCDDGTARPAYWRVLYCLRDVIPFWWSKAEAEQGRPSYRRVTAAESRRHGLGPVLAFTEALADLSGLDWFSTEVCLSEGSEASRYKVWTTAAGGEGREWPVVAIDYVNDQCDMHVQSRWLGAPPDNVVRYIAERFADAAALEARRFIVPEPPWPLRAA